MKLVPTLFFTFLFHFVFAQKIDQNLNKYFLPNVRYSSLIGNFNIKGSVDKNSNNLSSNLRLSYYTYRRTAKWQNFFYVVGQTSPSKQSSKNNEQLTWDNQVSIATQNRIYSFKHPMIYFEADLNTSINHRFLEKDLMTTNDIRNQVNISSSMPLLLGWGRVEDITETWRAVRLFQTFDEHGILFDNPTEKDILTLAKEIAIQKNKRFLDYRNGKIARLTAIHGILDSFSILNTNSISYYTYLSDIWNYGVNQRRSTGMAFGIGIEPHDFTSKQSQLLSKLPTLKRNAFLGIARFEYHKALNYQWQVDFDSRFRSGITHSAQQLQNTWVTTISTDFNTSYYPSDRTTFTFNLRTEYFINQKSFNYDLNFFMYNYLSPHFRLQTNLRYIKSYQFSPYAWYGDWLGGNGLNSFRYDSSTGGYLKNQIPRFSYDIRFIYNFF